MHSAYNADPEGWPWIECVCNDSEQRRKCDGSNCTGASTSLSSMGRRKRMKRLRDAFDRAGSSHSKDLLLRRIAAEHGLLTNIEAALQRLRVGSFGECISRGKEINSKRLEAVPWARY